MFNVRSKERKDKLEVRGCDDFWTFYDVHYAVGEGMWVLHILFEGVVVDYLGDG